LFGAADGMIDRRLRGKVKHEIRTHLIDGAMYRRFVGKFRYNETGVAARRLLARAAKKNKLCAGKARRKGCREMAADEAGAARQQHCREARHLV
jgi:hypothetical protein